MSKKNEWLIRTALIALGFYLLTPNSTTTQKFYVCANCKKLYERDHKSYCRIEKTGIKHFCLKKCMFSYEDKL